MLLRPVRYRGFFRCNVSASGDSNRASMAHGEPTWTAPAARDGGRLCAGGVEGTEEPFEAMLNRHQPAIGRLVYRLLGWSGDKPSLG